VKSISFSRPAFALLILGLVCWLGSSAWAETFRTAATGENGRPGLALAETYALFANSREDDRSAAPALFQEGETSTESSWWEGLKNAMGSWRPSAWEISTGGDRQAAVCPECQDLTVRNRFSACLKWQYLRLGGMLSYLQTGGRLSVLGSGIGGPLENQSSFTRQWKCEAVAGLGVLYWFNARTALQSGILLSLPGPLNYNRNAWTGPDQTLGSACAYLESVVALKFFI
jgi:hypothetical protein